MAARLGLKPWERDRMTPMEIKDMWNGMEWRLDQQRHIAAVGVSYVLAAWVTPPPIDEIEERMGRRGGS